MQITVNAEPRDLVADNLAAALAELGYSSAAIATAVNGKFVAKPLRAETMLKDGDRVEILSPMQGG